MINFENETLRIKCLNTEFFWSLFSRIWTKYRDLRGKSPYSVKIRERSDQKNSVFGLFDPVKLRYEFAKVVKLKLDLVKLQSREDEITVEASFGIMYSVMDNGIQWIRY